MSKVFTIRNKKTGFGNRPIYVNSKEEALNVIQNILVTDVDKALFYLKKDLDLLYMGEYDDVNCILYPVMVPDPEGVYKSVPGNEFVCSLEEIFDSIPAERIKPAVTRDEISALVEKVQNIDSDLKKLCSDVSSHTHPVKKGVPYFGENK